MNRLFFSALFVLTLAGCGTVQPTAPAKIIHHVEYRLTITGGNSDVTIANATGGTEQFRVTKSPWTLAFLAPTGQHLYLSGNAPPQGTVECVITVDGTVLQQAKAVGSYKIATCSGSA